MKDKQQQQLDDVELPDAAPVSTTSDPAGGPSSSGTGTDAAGLENEDDDTEDTAELDASELQAGDYSKLPELVGAFAVYDDDLMRYTGPTFGERADADDYRDALQRESGHVFVVHDL